MNLEGRRSRLQDYAPQIRVQIVRSPQMGPGSAAQHFVLRCARDTIQADQPASRAFISPRLGEIHSEPSPHLGVIHFADRARFRGGAA